MAKPVLSMDQMQQQEAELASQEAAASARANSSSTFWADNTPSSADVLADIRLRDIASRKEKLQSNIIARDTYGLPNDADVNAVNQPKESLISKTLNKLSTPLYGVVGTTSYLAGKGEPTIGESIATGIKNKETWGGLLRKVGVTPKVSMVAGFGLDVLTDPVNLLSGGMVGASRSGLGKIVVGAKRAGVEGAVLGAKVGATKTLNTIAKLVPGLSVKGATAKAIRTMAEKGISPETPEYIAAMRKVLVPSENALGKLIGKARVGKINLEEAVKNTADKYDALTNFNIANVVDSRANRLSILDKGVIAARESSPFGEKIMKDVLYDPYAHAQAAKAMDEAEYGLSKLGLVIKKGGIDPETGMKYEPTLEGAMQKVEDAFANAKKIPDNLYFDPAHPDVPIAREGLIKSIDDGVDMLEKGYDIPDTLHAVDAMQQEAAAQSLLEKYKIGLREVMDQDRLGAVDKINKAITKGLNLMIKDKGYVNKTLDAYDVYRGLFISSKITSLSPASLAYAIIGNPTMNLMYGFNIFHPDNYNRMKDAMSIVFKSNNKRSAEVFNWMVTDPMMVDLWEKRPKSFIDNFGINLRTFALDETASDLVTKSKELGALKGYGDVQKKLRLEKELTDSLQKTGMKSILKAMPSQDWKTSGVQLVSEGRNPTGMAQFMNENLSGFSKFKEKIAKTAEEGTGLKQYIAKKANWYFDRSGDFQKVDQSFKLKDFFRMTRDGITEKELLKITNNFAATNARIFKDDIAEAVWKGGTKYYKIKPEAAMDIASDIYMNYAAMPAFIRTLRALPVIGSPFFAFTYAMLAKTGKAALNNTAAFNKVNFFLQEISKDKSPLEREALNSKYYSYLDKPGMINLGENFPLFKGHPIYFNMTQMVPYYSLNIINPSERGFNDDIRGQFASAIDRTPLFKDPVGQIMMDYLVLPAILRDQAPVNMWGGPLYEPGASTPKKAAYALRSFGESLTPSLPSAALATTGIMSDEQLKWFPSYPGRGVGFGVQGKTTVGTIGQEDPASRGLRKWFSIFGFNFYPVDLQNVSTEIKSRQK